MTRLSMTTVPSMALENTFYKSIRPQLEIEAPIGYYSDFDTWSGRSIHLLEDLVWTKNATFPKPDTKISKRNAEDIVFLLAALHGSSAQILERSSNLARLISWPAIIQCTELRKQASPTLIHGDVHLGNWYVTGGDRMGLLDWQCVSKGHWSRDFAYAITATLTVENRRAWEEELVKFYLREFNARTGQDISFDEGWRGYRQQVFSALAFWTPTYAPPAFAPNNMQTEAMSLEMIKRFAQAIADLKSFDSLMA